MNTIKEILKINDEELRRGIAGTSASWHAKYLKSSWVYVGNLDHSLSEGDVICVLSQFGEIEDIHLIREEDTGKSKGFGFVKYEDARSCVLAVDNLCGAEICGRSLRIDHVENYRLPKHLLEKEEQLAAAGPGHAYQDEELANEYSLDKGQDLFAPLQKQQPANDTAEDERETKQKRKEERRRLREEKEKRKREREERRADKEEKRRKKRSRKYEEKDRRSRSASEDERERKRRKKEHKRSRSKE